MAHDLNRCEFIGRLGRDPELRYLPSGDPVANFQIAVGKSYKKNGTGEKVEETTWVPLSAFGQLAELAGKYLKKGAQVYVAGEFHVRKYQDKEGNDRWATEVRVDKMQMLGGKKDEKTESTANDYKDAKDGATKPKQPASRGSDFNDMTDDIPFANPYRGFVCHVV